MRTRALVAIAVLLAGALVAHAGGAVDGRLVQGLDLMRVAEAPPPPLALRRLDDGRTLTLQQLRGRPVLLYFWATW
ncbi:MAG TPA: hypothetical protein VHZ49_13535 [Methylomirabilota bacterium]|jgi:hypothetical protein|nr:hypothetical protein [Methylomirabilota bacterium]